MKKIFVILLSILYLASSAGATVQLHYCMDKLVGIDMHESHNEMCAKCGMKKQQGCCKDEGKQIKVGDDQKPASKFVFKVADGFSDCAYRIQQSRSLILRQSYDQPAANGPRKSGIDRYIYVCVFRI